MLVKASADAPIQTHSRELSGDYLCIRKSVNQCAFKNMPFIDHIGDKHVEADKICLCWYVYRCESFR